MRATPIRSNQSKQLAPKSLRPVVLAPLAVLLALAGDGQGGFEFADHGAHGGHFGLAALVFCREFGQPCCDVAPLGGQLGLGLGFVGSAPVGWGAGIHGDFRLKLMFCMRRKLHF